MVALVRIESRKESYDMYTRCLIESRVEVECVYYVTDATDAVRALGT